jgi:hypothetical protein
MIIIKDNIAELEINQELEDSFFYHEYLDNGDNPDLFIPWEDLTPEEWVAVLKLQSKGKALLLKAEKIRSKIEGRLKN